MATTRLSLILGADVRSLVKGLNKAERSLRQTAQRLNGIGNTLSRSLTLPLLGIGVAAVKTASDFQSLEKGLGTVMGSASLAKDELKKLQEVARLPGVGLKQAIKASVRLQAVKIEAKAARDLIQELGNAVATVGGGAADMDEVVNQFAQLAASANLTIKDIKVISERIPQFNEILLKAFGTGNAADLNKMFREGKLTVAGFVDSVTTEFQKLPRAEPTLKTAIENITIEFQKGLAVLGMSIAKNIDLEKTIKSLTDRITRTIRWWGELSDATKGAYIRAAKWAVLLGPGAKLLGGLYMLGAALKGVRSEYFKLGERLVGFPQTAAFVASGGMRAIPVIGGLAAAFLFARSSYKEMSSEMDLQDFEGPKEKVKALSQEIHELNEKIRFNKEVSAANIGGGGLGGAGISLFAGADEIRLEKLKEQREVQHDMMMTAEMDALSVKEATERSAERKEYEEAITKATEKRVKALKEAAKFTAFTELDRELSGILDDMAKEGDNEMELLMKVDDSEYQDFLIEHAKLQSRIKAGGLSAPDFTDLSRTATPDAPSIKLASPIEGLNEEMEEIVFTTERLKSSWMSLFEKGKIGFDELQSKMTETGIAVINIGEIIKELMVTTLVNAAQQLGAVLAGSKFSFKSLLLPIVQILQDLGKMAVATGVAMLGIKKAFKLHPLAAIAAGTALIALTAAVKTKASKMGDNIKLAEGGLAYGETLATVGDNPGARFNPEVIAPLDKLKDMIGGGGAMIAETVIRGNDLHLLVMRANENNNGLEKFRIE